jgi:hypothetical protein
MAYWHTADLFSHCCIGLQGVAIVIFVRDLYRKSECWSAFALSTLICSLVATAICPCREGLGNQSSNRQSKFKQSDAQPSSA